MSPVLPTQYKRTVLAERPKAHIDDKTFRTEVVPFDLKPAANEVLVKTVYISLDPAQRTWISDVPSYLPPVEIGAVMRSGGIGIVVEAGAGARFEVGDVLWGMFGWSEYVVTPCDAPFLSKIVPPPGTTVLDFLGPLGITGFTGYFGLTEIGKVKAGETLVVSGAAGATGSVVCQMGKKIGARVIAIAGTPAKCEWLEKVVGVDKALNYKSENFHQEFIDAVGHVDVYFDNVGGDILDLCLSRLNTHGRVVICGAISGYNDKPKGISNYANLISTRGTMQGFLVFDYAARYGEARAELAKWLADGSLKRLFHIVDGFEKCPEALPLLYNGGNTGKLVVKVCDLPESKL